MESVEVWMWTVAGLIIAGIVFVGGFIFLNSYLRNIEIGQAQDSFIDLSTSIQKVCAGGLYSRESKDLIFPFATDRIFTRPETGVDAGKQICLSIEGKLTCQELKCATNMEEISISGNPNIFYFLKKIGSKSNAAKYKFVVTKEGTSEIDVAWTQTVIT